jgi:hypothetical protein
VAQGGYGLVNVYVGGTAPTAFDDYNVTLSITPIGGSAGSVVFAPVGAAPDPANAAAGMQPFSYLYPAGSTAANYIFLNDSLDSSFGLNGGQPTLGQPSNFFTISDISNSGVDYTANATNDSPASPVPPTTLLASLLVQAVSTNMLDQFQISVSLDPSLTNFSDLANNVFSASQDTSVTGYSGTLTIAASSVPEPASIISGLTGLAAVIGFSACRRRGPKRAE